MICPRPRGIEHFLQIHIHGNSACSTSRAFRIVILSWTLKSSGMTGAATLSVPGRTLCAYSARVDSSTHVLVAVMGPLDLRLDFHVHDSRYTVRPRLSGPFLSGSLAIRKKIAGYQFTAYVIHTYSMYACNILHSVRHCRWLCSGEFVMMLTNSFPRVKVASDSAGAQHMAQNLRKPGLG